MTDLNSTLASRLREARRGAGFRSGDAVELATNGEIKAPTYYTYEATRTLPPIPVLIELARLFRVNPAWLIGESEHKYEPLPLWPNEAVLLTTSPNAENGVEAGQRICVDTSPRTINREGLWVLEDHRKAPVVVEVRREHVKLQTYSNNRVMPTNNFTVVGRVVSVIHDFD